MRIARQITQGGESPFAGITFRNVDVEICTADPSARVCLTDIEVPAHWSYAAAQTFVRYYIRRAGVPVAVTRVREDNVPDWLCRSVPDTAALMGLKDSARTTHEKSARQVFARMAGMWAYWGFKAGYFDSEDDARAFHDEACAMLARQMMAPNSPQWFNAGLHWAYGMTGPAQGHFYGEFEDNRMRRSVNAYERPQLHACFLHSVRDDLVNEGGIMNLFEREARAFKYGSGSGVNMSSIRASGEMLGSGARAGGLQRFMAVGDKAASAVQSGGLPRRAGKMVVVDIDHPDVLSFIRWKGEEQYKAAALITGARVMRQHLNAVMATIEQAEGEGRFHPSTNPALKAAMEKARRALIPGAAIERVLAYARQGYRELHIPIYSAQKDSEVFFTVSAHQGRQAVRVSNRFMQAAADKHRFALRKRTDGSVSAQEEAGELLDELAHAAWAAGEPAVHFTDAIAAAHTCPESGPIRAGTPASEYLFLDDTAAPLACINLLALADAKGFLDAELFDHVVRLSTVMLDISVGIAQYPSRDMARRTLDTRPVGLGFANLAGLFARLGIAYDSAEARATAAAVSGLLTAQAQVTSAELAKELGAFGDFARNRAPYLKTLAERRAAAEQGFAALPQDELALLLARSMEMAQIKTEAYGARNAQLSCVPPTATIARVMDCETLGIAPLAALVRYAPQQEGSLRKSLSPNVMYGLQALGYSQAQIEDITRYVCGHRSLARSPSIDHAALRAKGFGDAQVASVEESLAEAADIHAAFDPWVIGEEFCRTVLKLSEAQLHDARFNLLAHLGFGASEIEAAHAHACGTQHLHAAPHVKPQHEQVFATGGKLDENAPQVSAVAQVAMMAAVQPFLTGGIAHTINLPHETPTAECRELITGAWEAGLKSLSLHREGCALYDETAAEETGAEEFSLVFREARASFSSALPQVAAELARRFLQAKRELPSRRNGFTQEVSFGGQKLVLRTGEFEDGSLGEIALDMPGERASYRTLLQQCARSISLALQYGVPLSAFTDAFARGQLLPTDAAHAEVMEEAASALEQVFGELQASYVVSHPEAAENVIPLTRAG